MSSLEIAELTGKRHKHVMTDVRKMLTELENQPDEFSSDWTDARGRKQKHFVLDHDHTMCLVSGYKVQLRMAVIQRLRALESGEVTPWHEQQAEAAKPEYQIPQSYAEALRLAADETERAS
ncbi:Rha family transcriptional regulator [Salinisphaera sp. USBA-960]|nr:Rha family transcriptional regulator [Salifodinibacter halophilus]